MKRLFLLIAVAAASSAAEPWGIRIDRDDAGRLAVTLENSSIRVRYAWKKLAQDETFVREFSTKSALGINHAGDRIDAGANREELLDARIVRSTPDSQTVRLEWKPLAGRKTPGIQEVTLERDSAALRIDYIRWPVNIVDIGTPGGAKTGDYVIYGASSWKRPMVIYPNMYFCRVAGEVGKENLTEVDDPGPLDYHGWFIMGVVNPANGQGFGRVVPVESIDIVKLLWNKGFELFPYFGREKKPFSSYLFAVTGGAAGILAEGRRLADRAK